MATGLFAFVAVCAILLAGQAGLVAIAPALAGAKPTTFAEVLPLIGLLSSTATVGLLAALIANRVGREGAASIWHRPQPGVLTIGILTGLVMRLVWLGAPPPLEDDFYRYLWDGALTAHGLNPYGVAPDGIAAASASDPALARLANAAGDVLARINFPDLITIYPGTAQLAFAMAYLVKPFSADGLRIVFLLSDVCALAILLALISKLGASPLNALLYWANPLVVFATMGVVHVDALIVPLVLGAVLAAVWGRPLWCAAALALAAGVKLWPVLLAPLLLLAAVRARPEGRLQAGAAALAVFSVLTLALTGPLALSATRPGSGLAAYAASWYINNAPYAWASYGLYLGFGESAAAQSALRMAVAAAAACVAVWAAVTALAGLNALTGREIAARALLVSAAIFYLSPAQFPWYALWFLGLAAALASFPLLAASITLAAYYAFFPLWETGRGNTFQYGVAFLHSLPVWLWLALSFRQDRDQHRRQTTSI